MRSNFKKINSYFLEFDVKFDKLLFLKIVISCDSIKLQEIAGYTSQRIQDMIAVPLRWECMTISSQNAT